MEKIPQQSPKSSENKEQKTVIAPLSLEYFNNTAEGKRYKEEIISLLPDLNQQFKFPGGEQFRMLDYLHQARIKYFLGEKFEDDIEAARGLFKNVQDTQQKQLMENNYADGLMSLMEEFQSPDDRYVEQLLRLASELSTADFILKNHKQDKSALVQRVASLYAESGNFEKIPKLFEEIKSPFHQIIFFTDLIKTTDDREQVESLLSKAKNIFSKVNKSDYLYRKAAEKLIYALAQNGYQAEIGQILNSMSNNASKINTLLSLAKMNNFSEDTKNKFLQSALEIAESESNSDIDKNNNYGRIAAWYVDNNNTEKADEILKLNEPGTTFQPSSFLEGLSPHSLRHNERAREYVTQYLADETVFKPVSRDINNGTFIKTFTQMGLNDEAMDIIADLNLVNPHITLSNINSFINGINDYLSAEKTNKKEIQQNTGVEFYADIFSTPKKAFWAGYFMLGKKEHMSADIPEHIQIAYELGESYDYKYKKYKKTPYDFGALHDAKSVRTFLQAMENYKFENIPEALESILQALPEEADQAVYEFISTNPEAARRLIKVLISIDANKGSRYALDLIARKSTPDKVFTYFSKLFMEHGRFTKELAPFLSEPEDILIVRRLVSQYPNQLNNVIDTLAQIGLKNFAKEETLWDALEDLGTLTPGIYKKYRSLNPLERKKFVEKVEKFDYSNFFENKPVPGGEADQEFDQDVMLDLLYRAYNPVNMSYERVRELLPQVKDRTGDLKNYFFPSSYDVEFSVPSYVLKTGESISGETLGKIKNVLNSADDQLTDEAFLKLIRATTDFTEAEAAALFSVLRNESQVLAAKSNMYSGLDTNAFQDLSSLKEIFGVFAADNFGTKMMEKIKQENKISNKAEQLLKNHTRRKNLLKALGYQSENELTESIPTIELASRLFAEQVLSKYVVLINKELRKFISSPDAGQAKKNAKAYVSKNQGSFFAKATAGICTAGDVELWDMPNHFHINIVNENQMVKGNTMAYIENVEGKKSLVLRGFNPSDMYLKEITAESFVEEMLKVARDFKKLNNLEHIYIIIGGTWDSNRPQIRNYLAQQYLSKLKAVPYEMAVSGFSKTQGVFLLE